MKDKKPKGIFSNTYMQMAKRCLKKYSAMVCFVVQGHESQNQDKCDHTPLEAAVIKRNR